MAGAQQGTTRKRLEDFDPDHADEIPVKGCLLQRAVVARARTEQQPSAFRVGSFVGVERSKVSL